jgi:hypothetical protein
VSKFAVRPLLRKLLGGSVVNDKEGSSRCRQYFGYLTGLSKTASMPEECLTCPEMLECRNVLNSSDVRARVFDSDYLNVKIEESRHRETQAYLIFVAGVVLLVGGLLEIVIAIEDPDWFLFFPYKLTGDTYSQCAYARLGLFMVLNGLFLLVLGILLGISYGFTGKKYLNRLSEVYGMKRNEESKASRVKEEQTIPSDRQLEKGKDEELKECVNHLTLKMHLSEADSVWYCKRLGRHWRELS